MRGTFVKLPAPTHLLRAMADRPLAALAAAALVALTSGCTPKIGDSCFTSTDCSQRGDRLCDTAQPGGYCTLFNCRANLCPDEAACVLFDPQIPGCGFDDRSGAGGSRVARSACVKSCEGDSDCRDGYLCVNPTQGPWRALVLDDDQSKRTCLPAPTGGLSVDAGPTTSSAPVCRSENPPAGADAGDAGARDGGADAGDAGARDGGAGG
jgi:hypothetical protein